MTFYSGVKKLYEIINEIADGLIAADPTNWSDADSLVKSEGEFTNWVQDHFLPNAYSQNPLLPLPEGTAYARAEVINNEIYFIGGETAGGTTSNCYKIDLNDPSSDWISISPMSGSRHGHAIGLINGKIYVAGGYDGSGYTGSIEEYDPSTDSWTTKSATITPRERPPHCVHNGELYIFGGSTTDEVEKYDPVTDTVTYLTSSPQRLGGGAAVSDGTNIWVTGGYDSTNRKALYLFDPVNKTFTSKADLSPYDVDISSGRMFLRSDPDGGYAIWFLYPYYGNEDVHRAIYRINPNTWTYLGGTGNNDYGYRGATVQIEEEIYAIGGGKSGYHTESQKIFSEKIYRNDNYGSNVIRFKNNSVYRSVQPTAQTNQAWGQSFRTDIMELTTDNYLYQSANSILMNFAGYDPNNSIVWTTNRRVLYHSDGIYLTLEDPNWEEGYSNERMQGLRLVLTSSWDNLSHDYPIPEGYSTYLQWCGRYTTTTGVYSISTSLSYWLWVDANGFVLMATPESTTSDRQGAFILVCERNPNKEYLDGQSNFFVYSRCNKYEYHESHFGTTDVRAHRRFVRPFVVHSSGENGIEFKFEGMKSLGNGKIYYIKPIIYNDSAEGIPIMQSESFFKIKDVGSGIVDGDIILIEGESTQYLVKMISSPDSGTILRYAMKYVA